MKTFVNGLCVVLCGVCLAGVVVFTGVMVWASWVRIFG